MEGKLTMQASRGANLGDDAPAVKETLPAGEHALVVRSKSGAMKPRDIKPDEKGWYAVALPPGDYILELKDSDKGSRPRRLMSTERKFTVTAGETVRVDVHVAPDLQQMR